MDQKPVLSATQVPSDTQKLQELKINPSAQEPLHEKTDEPAALRRLGHIDECGYDLGAKANVGDLTEGVAQSAEGGDDRNAKAEAPKGKAEEEQKTMERACLPEDVAAIAQIFEGILHKAVEEDTVKNRAGAFEKADDDELLRMMSTASQHPDMSSFRVYMEIKEGLVGYEIGDVDCVYKLLAFGYWKDACYACKAEKIKAERKSKSKGRLSIMSQRTTEQSNVKRPAWRALLRRLPPKSSSSETQCQ